MRDTIKTLGLIKNRLRTKHTPLKDVLGIIKEKYIDELPDINERLEVYCCMGNIEKVKSLLPHTDPHYNDFRGLYCVLENDYLDVFILLFNHILDKKLYAISPALTSVVNREIFIRDCFTYSLIYGVDKKISLYLLNRYKDNMIIQRYYRLLDELTLTESTTTMPKVKLSTRMFDKCFEGNIFSILLQIEFYSLRNERSFSTNTFTSWLELGIIQLEDGKDMLVDILRYTKDPENVLYLTPC